MVNRLKVVIGAVLLAISFPILFDASNSYYQMCQVDPQSFLNGDCGGTLLFVYKELAIFLVPAGIGSWLILWGFRT